MSSWCTNKQFEILMFQEWQGEKAQLEARLRGAEESASDTAQETQALLETLQQ